MVIDWDAIKAVRIPEGDCKRVAINGTIVWEKGGLPSEYQQVEYIESTGTQYIQTNYAPKISSRLCVEWELVSALKGTNSTIMGVHDSATKMWQIRQGGLVVCGNISSSWTNIGSVNGGLVVMDFGTVDINGTNRTFKTGTYQTPDNGIILCGLLTNGFLNQNALIAMRIKKFKAYDVAGDEESIVRDFVPCYRIADGEIGMYDLVNGVFYTNAGSGTFIKGEDV